MYGRHDKWLRYSGLLLALFFAAFAVITVVRSAYQQTRKTDLTVYLRAAWAAHAGEDLYTITDEHGWHYHYPPLFASLMVPFAQPPADSGESAWVPFPTVVVVWYLFGLFCIVASTLALSKSLSTLPAHRSQKAHRWLVHGPVWVLLPAIASSMGRGQINELILLAIAATLFFALRGQRVVAGACLAVAASIKVIPALLLIYPLWKRDKQWLVGSAVGLVLGLLVIPSAIIGPGRTVTAYHHWVDQLIHPALADETGSARARELLDMTATDNQAFQGMIHNWTHLDRATRPRVGDPVSKVAHWLLFALMVVVTLVVGKRSEMKEPHREAVTFAALIVPMLLGSPVCHLHYFVLLMPLIIALTAGHIANGGRVRPALASVLIINFFTSLLPRLPGCEYLRDVGLASLGAIALWTAAMIELGGESATRIRLPGYRKALEMARRGLRRRRLTSQTAGQRMRVIPPNTPLPKP